MPKSPSSGLLDIIKSLKEASNMFQGYTFHKGMLPGTDNCVAFLNTGGLGAEPSISLSHPSVQVLARGSVKADSYDTTWALLNQVENALLGIPTPQAQYPELMGVTWSSQIQDLGYDEMKRPLFSLNFRLEIEPEQQPGGHRMAL